MRILQVIHDFLPRHNAGSEIYTYHVTRELARRGHEVAVFCTECIPDRPQYTLLEREFEGIPIFEAVHNHAFRSFEATYLDGRMERVFRGILKRFRPDVVHLQHLQYHSLGYVRRAREVGAPVLFTLHEYFLQCPRKGLMLRDDLTLCAGVDEPRCADCMAHDSMAPLVFGETRVRVNDWVKAHVPGRLRRMVHKRLVRYGLAKPPRAAPTAGESARDHAAEIRDRHEAVLDACREVDLFLAPSKFLRGKFVEFGIPPERIRFSDYGFVDAGYRNVRRTTSDRVRFGFMGTLVEFKGAHLILEAFRRLPPGRAEVRVYGDLNTFPAYANRLRSLAMEPDCRLMGRFENHKVAEILADLDVLIVPSLWYENSPLTIHEAFLAGIPVIATDLGGMADLVQDGVNGLLFERGSAENLAEKMGALVREPERIRRLAGGIVPVKTIEEDVAAIEEIYRELVASCRAGAAAATGPGGAA